MAASVVIRMPATEAACCRAVRTTLAGSMTPALTMSTYSSVWALKPKVADQLSTGEDGDVFQHRLAAIAEAHRFPAEVIRHAVWLYFRFTLSFRDVEELLAQRGLEVSYETRGEPKK